MSRDSNTNGWLEAAVAWEVCASIHLTYAKGKDAVFTTRQADFARNAELARSKAKAITCTCPSGDGSLSWPCPQHPPAASKEGTKIVISDPQQELRSWRNLNTPIPRTPIPQAPVAPTKTVDDLQRELLAICRGGAYADAWRRLNAPGTWPSLKGEIGKLARVRELREQIKALDPNAALYYGWAGPGDDQKPLTPAQRQYHEGQ